MAIELPKEILLSAVVTHCKAAWNTKLYLLAVSSKSKDLFFMAIELLKEIFFSGCLFSSS